MNNYDGLTKNTWPGTWAPVGQAPIVVDTDIRGALRGITGSHGDTLTDIPPQRISEGMLVYIKSAYTTTGYSRVGDTYYKYSLLPGQSRDNATGNVPNTEDNWSLFSPNGGSAYNTRNTVDISVDVMGDNFTDFDIPLPLTCSMATMIQCSLSAPGTLVIYGMVGKNDTNPYTFVSTPTSMSDDGSTVMSDGSIVRNRRYSILANTDVPPTNILYGRVYNDTADQKVINILLELVYN